ncbi:MAG: GNAT family N-acetyltransferase [Chloroflexi bacterium]|nr:GNAT family N-acetyltransferase [Chloroflexota bacterium]MCI0820334.1 GNAT family N-acetyltransferase [Chloroflexota bacterium]MCI0886144.1 GNAT family N-acetyltransferase [Chloroflexota bacterium]
MSENAVLQHAIEGGRVAVALEGREVVGYLRWEWLWDHIPLCVFVRVRPPHQRTGLGRALYARVEPISPYAAASSGSAPPKKPTTFPCASTAPSAFASSAPSAISVRTLATSSCAKTWRNEKAPRHVGGLFVLSLVRIRHFAAHLAPIGSVASNGWPIRGVACLRAPVTSRRLARRSSPCQLEAV